MQQKLSILEQKFSIPELNVTLTPRYFLLEQLAKHQHLPIITLVCPAGFGKSTLMAQHLKNVVKNQHNKVVWIGLDSSDNQANQFFNMFCQALVYMDIADKSIINRVNNRSAKEDLVSFSQDILNILQNSKENIFILLDDFHFISNHIILSFVDRLLQYCPEQLHFIITSRVQPPLALSSFYAQGSLFHLGSEQLKFSLSEAQQLLTEFVEEEKLLTLYQQTEGWPVALQLLRLWYRAHPEQELGYTLTHNVDALTSYIKEQVFEKFSAITKSFLLKTSLVERFDLELAAYLCDIDHCGNIIASINQHQALIVSLDDEKHSFRYHHLFSDFLQNRLLMDIGISGCNELRSKAAKWFAKKGYLSEAINQCMIAGNISLAISFVSQAGGWELVLLKGIGYAESILSHFNQKMITQSPMLGLLQSYLYLKLGQVVLAQEQFRLVEKIHQDLLQADKKSDANDRDIMVMGMLVKLYLDQFINDDESQVLVQAISALSTEDHLAKGTFLASLAVIYNQNAKFALAEKQAITSKQEMLLANCWVGVNYITLHHGQSLAYRGHLVEALDKFNQASQLAKEHFGIDSGLQSMSMCLTADIYYQMGQLAEAKKLLEQGIVMLELRDSWYDIYQVTFKLAIDIALYEEDKQACQDYLLRGQKISMQRQLWRLAMLLDVLALKVAWYFGDNKSYEQLNHKIIRERYWQEELYLWKAKEEYHTIQALYYLQKNNSSKALFHTDKLLTICENTEQIIEVSKAKLIRALAYFSIDKHKKAFAELADVCGQCSQYQIKQIFFEMPNRIKQLLHKYQKEYEQTLSPSVFAFIDEIIQGLKQQGYVDQSLGLSNREQELIPFLIKGLSNKQIATQLGVSDNTVKFHLKNLFAKVNAQNRNEAAMFFMKSENL